MSRCLTIGMVTLKPGNRAAAEAIADQGAPGVAQQPGFESVAFIIDESNNQYGAVAIWESREAAEKADAVLNPGFTQAFGDLLDGPIRTTFYEIYEHKR